MVPSFQITEICEINHRLHLLHVPVILSGLGAEKNQYKKEAGFDRPHDVFSINES